MPNFKAAIYLKYNQKYNKRHWSFSLNEMIGLALLWLHSIYYFVSIGSHWIHHQTHIHSRPSKTTSNMMENFVNYINKNFNTIEMVSMCWHFIKMWHDAEIIWKYSVQQQKHQRFWEIIDIVGSLSSFECIQHSVMVLTWMFTL